jgi:predicted thioredoxin/glutaredoxin
MEPVDIVPPEKVAFIAYNIGVYESVQKFGGLITSGKITSNTDVAKVAELLSESNAFYDAEMISQLVNAMLQQQQHRKNSTIKRVTAAEVSYIINQLKAAGVSIP